MVQISVSFHLCAYKVFSAVHINNNETPNFLSRSLSIKPKRKTSGFSFIFILRISELRFKKKNLINLGFISRIPETIKSVFFDSLKLSEWEFSQNQCTNMHISDNLAHPRFMKMICKLPFNFMQLLHTDEFRPFGWFCTVIPVSPGVQDKFCPLEWMSWQPISSFCWVLVIYSNPVVPDACIWLILRASCRYVEEWDDDESITYCYLFNFAFASNLTGFPDWYTSRTKCFLAWITELTSFLEWAQSRNLVFPSQVTSFLFYFIVFLFYFYPNFITL